MYERERARANSPRPRALRRVGTAAASALLATASLVVTFAVAEGASRLAGYRGLELYRPDSVLGWVLEPGQETVTRAGHLPVVINRDGFRDEPLSRPKPASVVRIYALGGSSTFGWGVRQDQVYHQVLERMLNDSARARGSAVRFEIVNAGIIGYNLWQASRLMRRLAEDGEADGFLLAYTFNDAWNRVGGMAAGEMERLWAGVRRKNLLRRSAFFNWLIDLRARRLSDAVPEEGVADALAAIQTGDSVTTPAELASYRATLDSVVALARERRLALGFTLLAARGQRQLRPRQRVMLETAEAAAVPTLDLVPAFDSMQPDSAYLPHDAVHPSASGHAVIARRTYAILCAAARAARAGEPAAIYRPGCGAMLEASPR